MALTDWSPEAVPVAIGGTLALVSELRLRDLAGLSRYIGAKLGGSPLAGIDDLPADDYPDALRAAYDATEAGAWPPGPGSHEGQAVLFGDDSVAGRAFFLTLVLRETVGLDAISLATTITGPEWEQVERIAWALTASHRDEVVRRIDRHLGLPGFAPRGRGEAGEVVTWSRAIGEVICGSEKREPLPWASPTAVMNLTLSQWRMVRSGGDDAPEEDLLPDDGGLVDRVNAARRAFFYPDAPTSEAHDE